MTAVVKLSNLGDQEEKLAKLRKQPVMKIDLEQAKKDLLGNDHADEVAEFIDIEQRTLDDYQLLAEKNM